MESWLGRNPRIAQMISEMMMTKNWWQKLTNLSPTTRTCHQNISSPTTLQPLGTIWYVMFFHFGQDSCECSRTLFFGIQETMFQTRCYAKKRKKWEFERKEYRITNLHLQPETNLQKHQNQHLHRNAICINFTCTLVYLGEVLGWFILC